jgi:hypothetical protein
MYGLNSYFGDLTRYKVPDCGDYERLTEIARGLNGRVVWELSEIEIDHKTYYLLVVDTHSDKEWNIAGRVDRTLVESEVLFRFPFKSDALKVIHTMMVLTT